MDLVPKIDSCYFITLETASKIIGILESIIYGIYFMYSYIDQLITDLHPDDNVRVVIFAAVESYMEKMGKLLVAAFGIYLIIGIKNKSREFVLAWIFLKISSIIILTLNCVFLIIPFPGVKTVEDPWIKALEILGLNGLDLLCLFVIYNYYRTILKGNLVEEEEETQ